MNPAAATEAFAEFLAERVADLVAKRLEERSASAPRYATSKRNPMGSGRRFRAAASRGEFRSFKDGREVKALWKEVEAAMDARMPELSKEEREELAAELMKPRRNTRPMFVYFVRAELTGLIKIGLTRDLQKRTRSFVGSSGGKITLFHFMLGTRADEEALHTRFDDARREGEWFDPVPELLGYIEQLKGGQ